MNKRERQEQKKAPERATISLMANGEAHYGYWLGSQHEVVLRWTPERVWIESERNRELARKLRYTITPPEMQSVIREAADALDGGQP